jgi:hypothetical protein
MRSCAAKPTVNEKGQKWSRNAHGANRTPGSEINISKSLHELVVRDQGLHHQTSTLQANTYLCSSLAPKPRNLVVVVVCSRGGVAVGCTDMSSDMRRGRYRKSASRSSKATLLKWGNSASRPDIGCCGSPSSGQSKCLGVHMPTNHKLNTPIDWHAPELCKQLCIYLRCFANI